MTFGQSLNTFADRVLGKALGAVEAGACIPSNGQFCACVSGACCAAHGKLLFVRYSCLGQCNKFFSNGHSCICCT